jgi:hypothetical protein
MKFIVSWNAGFGEVETVIEAEDIWRARDYAHTMALDQFESNATWGARLAEEAAVEWGGVNGQKAKVGSVERT